MILKLPNGTVIVDPEWHTVADVMVSFHGFGVRQAYGQLQTNGREPLTEMLPYQERI